MKRAAIFIITLIITSLPYCKGANNDDIFFTNSDKIIFNELIEKLTQLPKMSKGELMVTVAKEFIGTPYVAGSIEVIPETLSAYLHQTDCILFVESCLAITELISHWETGNQLPTFDEYCQKIKLMRYRNGIINGYSSRLHYTSEWILQNEQRGILKEYSSDYGERSYQSFYFMSSHPESYKQLKESPQEVAKIKEVEESLTRQTKIYTIAPEKIKYISDEIKDGDIICFVSTVKGLDIAHVGIAYHDNGNLTFIHASSSAKKVIIEPRSLIEYTKKRHIRLLHII